MINKSKTGIFIFRRDLRLQDNLGLNDILRVCDNVVPIFILDPYQLNKRNHYFSDKSVKFMADSLNQLDKDLRSYGSKLQYYNGNPHKVIKDLIENNSNITCVAFNGDFSPYSKIRDKKIEEVCKELNVECIINNDDLLLHPIDKVLSDTKAPFTVFGSYYKKAIHQAVKNPIKITKKNVLSNKSLTSSFTNLNPLNNLLTSLLNNEDVQQGGRNEGLKILKSLKNFNEYYKKRDLLTYETTQLSAHLKFGTISIREAYEFIKKTLKNSESGKALIRQLYWRMFYFILANNRKTLDDTGYGHIEKRFRDLKWASPTNTEKYGKILWEDGNTGFPVIDACIRQLNSTGWMHNRGRLLVASFAVNVLHLDPFDDGKWSCQVAFSRELVDCCYANNYGNWMWILGPYDPGGYRYGKKGTFGGRVFKDIVSFKKYDPNLEFIRKWIPELKDVPDKDVFKWNTSYTKYRDVNYPAPIVNFDERLNEWYKITKK